MPCDSHVAVLSAAKSVWDLFVTDQGTFWAAISIAVHELKQLVTREQRHEIEKAGLQMKGRGLSDLRQTLANGLDIRPTINIIYHVKALFRESCGSGDLEAARLHARSFNWLINNLAPYAKPPSLLRVVLWSDAVYALRQLRRPVVYYSDWMPQLSRDICELASPLLAAMPRSPGDEPPECVLSSPLREAFLQAQYALHISTYLILESDSWDAAQEKELIFLWITTQAERHICKLLDLYFDLLEPRSVLPSTPNPSQRCTEAALTVALLYTLQKSFCAVILDNRSDLHESAGAVHQSLKQMAQQAHQHWSESEHSLYQQPYIWVLFVGATCEERLRLECSNGIDLNRASDMQWFHRELAKVAKLPHLTNWTDARVVLSRFALNERLDPNALVWFEATVHGSRPIE